MCSSSVLFFRVSFILNVTHLAAIWFRRVSLVSLSSLMTLSPIKYKLGTSKRLGDILDYVYTQCRRSVVTRKVLWLRPCLYSLSSSRIAQRKITLVAPFIGLHFQISARQKVGQYWLPCSLWAENQNNICHVVLLEINFGTECLRHITR